MLLPGAHSSGFLPHPTTQKVFSVSDARLPLYSGYTFAVQPRKTKLISCTLAQSIHSATANHFLRESWFASFSGYSHERLSPAEDLAHVELQVELVWVLLTSTKHSRNSTQHCRPRRAAGRCTADPSFAASSRPLRPPAVTSAVTFSVRYRLPSQCPISCQISPTVHNARELITR